MPPLLASDTSSVYFSGTLEVKATKEDAHGHYINSVAFSPDGKTIVSGSVDQAIKVWNRLQWSRSTHSQFDAHARGVAERLFFVTLLLLKFVPGTDRSGEKEMAERIVQHVCNQW